MAAIQKIYRDDITEDGVNVVGLYIDDMWKYQRESIPVPKYPKLAKHAVVIGNGKSSREIDLSLILPCRETTAWGEKTPWVYKRQRKNFYTYGCNALYRDYRVDFLIATGVNFLKEISADDYCESNIVYANTKFLETYPNKFHYIPQNPELNSGAIAAYLAAFDGHKKVFMLGFDGLDNTLDNYNVYAGTPNYFPKNEQINENYWVNALDTVMKVYSDTEFVRVCPTKKFRTPELWKYNLNFRQIDFRQFVLEADV